MRLLPLFPLCFTKYTCKLKISSNNKWYWYSYIYLYFVITEKGIWWINRFKKKHRKLKMARKSCLWKLFQLTEVVPLKGNLTDFVLEFVRELKIQITQPTVPQLWAVTNLNDNLSFDLKIKVYLKLKQFCF